MRMRDQGEDGRLRKGKGLVVRGLTFGGLQSVVSEPGVVCRGVFEGY